MNIAKQEECPRCGASKRPEWNYDAQICSCGYGEASAPPAAPAAPAPPEDVERVARAICCPDGECRAAKHDDGFRSGKYILPMPCNWTSHKDEARAALSASAPPAAPADELARVLDALIEALARYRAQPSDCCKRTLRLAEQVADEIAAEYGSVVGAKIARAIRNLSTRKEPSHDR